MLVRDICRSFADSAHVRWHLKGEWRPEERKRCYIGRKSVSDWVIHLQIGYNADAIVQFVPKGFDGKQLLAPEGDDFRWGTRSSKALPPPYRQ
jgi:hypothetical protein